MSQRRKIGLTCSNCSKQFDFEVWDSINATLDPEQKQKILNGSIFAATCPQCNSQGIVPFGFLYHDMRQQLMLWFDFDENETDESQSVFPKEFLEYDSNYRLRYVCGYNRFKEKILIFDNKLDDIEIEQIKYGLIRRHFSNKEQSVKVYFNGKSENTYFFYIHEDGKEKDYIQKVSLIEINEYKNNYCLQFDTIKEGLEILNINQQWIKKTLEPMPTEDVLQRLKKNYDYVGFRPYEGRIIVKKNKLEGFVDIYGNEIIPLIYRNVLPFVRGQSVVSLAIHKYGLIDRNGNEIISCRYDNVRPFKDGFAMIEKGIYWSVINENHKTVVPFSRKYQQISEFNDGIAFVKLDTKWGAINTKGDIVIPVKYYEIEKFICGIARMRLKPKLYGYIDMNGNEVIQPIYEMLSIPQFGVIAYLHNHKWGLMDTSGNIILESAYDYIQTFNNSGFAVAAIYNRPVNLTSYPRKKGLPLGIFDGKYGIIDTSGNTIVDLNYDYISDINDDDLAIVMINGKFGMINIKGDVVIEPIYHHCDTVIEKYHEMIERQ